MKFLLLFFIFMVIAFQWRQARKPKVSSAERKTAAPTGALSMVACARCGVHLPENEALQGAKGVYCSAAHRQAQEH